ncbi:MAG: AsmA-like C-terminal region-containing protein [Candidatus Omnitrophica bacterium]|nr:AsmA-like C-terminal region-containing protein [Candidatus Omnitrophota bacterium]
MLRFISSTIKVLVLLVVLALLALALLYAKYGEDVKSEVRMNLETELSKVFDGEVAIESLGYRFPLSVALNTIKITPHDPLDEVAFIDKLTLTIEPFTLIRNKRLTAIVDLSGFRKGDMVSHAQVKTMSRPAPTLDDISQLGVLDSVSILDGELRLGKLNVRKILGDLGVRDGKVTTGKIDFVYKEKHYFLLFRAVDEDAKKYDLSFRADNLNLSCRISKEPGKAVIETLKGKFYIMRLDLRGELINPTSAKSSMSLSGSVHSSLEDVRALPEGMGKFGREHELSGMIRSTLHLKAPEPDAAVLTASGTFFAENLKFDHLKMESAEAKWTIKNGRFTAPDVLSVLYGGRLRGNLKVDIADAYIPYRADISLKAMDFGAFLYDATKKKVNVYGTMDSEISLSGLAARPESVDGSGALHISDAGLGPMPIITPLLGNLYVSIEQYFPERYKVNINDLSMSFNVRDRRLSTHDLKLLGRAFLVTAEGYMDFDGKIDFFLKNELREPVPDENSSWQISLRNAISGMGKNLGRARVRGTFSDPQWSFEFGSR